jgi:hypothetical protein
MAYAACNLPTLGHYRYTPLWGMVPRTHAFIVFDAILACALAVYLMLPFLH